MVLSRSLWRKLLVTLGAAVAFFLLYQATMIDSRSVPGARVAPITAGTRLRFTATAYCKGTITASGAGARSGVAASDPGVLPLGSIIRVDGAPERHNGIYTVLDTGPAVQGRQIDLYMWSCYEALAFGRRAITVTVLRLAVVRENFDLKEAFEADALATNSMLDTSLRLPARQAN